MFQFVFISVPGANLIALGCHQCKKEDQPCLVFVLNLLPLLRTALR